jgi:hypothetical protein
MRVTVGDASISANSGAFGWVPGTNSERAGTKEVEFRRRFSRLVSR